MSEAQEVRLFIGWDLFLVGTCWETVLCDWTYNDVLGNDTCLFCQNDGFFTPQSTLAFNEG